MTQKRGDIIEHSATDRIGYDTYPAWLKQRLEWFMDQRFGLILHWAPCSQWDCCESWPLVPEPNDWARNDAMTCWVERNRDFDRFCRDYWALNRTFKPTRFNPDHWAEIAQAAGARYVTYTTKHHDGFCMWDTRTTDYRITHPDCPFHADPRADTVRGVFDAFRKRNMAISCYFSKSDWHCPWYWAPQFPVRDRNVNYDTDQHPEIWQSFVHFVHRQIEELMTNYGPIDVLWLDGGQVRPPAQDIRMDEIAAMARRHQPGLIIADRTVGGVNENFITPEQEIPDAPLGVPWESCITLGKGWKYNPRNVYKSVGQVIRMLVETVSKGGNLLLGVGPSPDGNIPAEDEKRLRAIGAWLSVNGEAIYRTRPIAPYQEGNIRFTRRGDTCYAILLPDADGRAPEQLTLASFRPADGSTVTLLDGALPVRWQPRDAGCTLILPQPLPPAAAWCFRFRLGGGKIDLKP